MCISIIGQAPTRSCNNGCAGSSCLEQQQHAAEAGFCRVCLPVCLFSSEASQGLGSRVREGVAADPALQQALFMEQQEQEQLSPLTQEEPSGIIAPLYCPDNCVEMTQLARDVQVGCCCCLLFSFRQLSLTPPTPCCFLRLSLLLLLLLLLPACARCPVYIYAGTAAGLPAAATTRSWHRRAR